MLDFQVQLQACKCRAGLSTDGDGAKNTVAPEDTVWPLLLPALLLLRRAHWTSTQVALIYRE